MKQVIVLALLAALAAGCKKNNCVQCQKQVKAATQTTTVTTDYNVVSMQFCGRQADTAMSANAGESAAFAAEYNLVQYTCFYYQ